MEIPKVRWKYQRLGDMEICTLGSSISQTASDKSDCLKFVHNITADD